MLKKIFDVLRSDKAMPAHNLQNNQTVTLERADHSISRKQISKNALSVMYELNRAGFESYLVGGGVRDLLLGKSPKDFDIATDAKPEQVQALFKRSRIVGRRFKIVHVRFGREIIEVTTFRTSHNKNESGSTKSGKQNDQGMLVIDNVYGNLRDDALRRDFTINALYYSVDGFQVIDYADGLKDLEDKTIRIIGEPEQRYREDPVRMLRAVRFAAKLDFAIENNTATPITPLNTLLSSVAPARLFDEMSKLFLSGHAEKTLELLIDYKLLRPLFPNAAKLIEDRQSQYYRLINAALKNTDQRLTQKKSVTPAFMLASLLWPHFSSVKQTLEQQGTPKHRAMQIAGHRTIDEQQSTIAIPRRFSIVIREIWGLQYNLESAKGKRAIALLSNPRFRAAYDFLLMREKSGETFNPGSIYWTKLQQEHPDLLNTYEKKRNYNHKNKRKPRNYRGSQSTP